jgi:hypothetical protein
MERVEANAVIPTRYRSKIANSLSYPLGSEVISAALVDVPQFSQLAVSFHEDYSRRRAAFPDLANYRVLGISLWKLEPERVG